MCQQQALNILKKNRKWMTAKQIKEQMKGVGIGSTRHNLYCLRKQEIIISRINKSFLKHNENQYKIR